MDLSVVDKRTIKELVFSAFSSSFLGGTFLGMGVDQIIFNLASYRWIGDFLLGFAFLGLGIFWAVMLLRRVRAELSK